MRRPHPLLLVLSSLLFSLSALAEEAFSELPFSVSYDGGLRLKDAVGRYDAKLQVGLQPLLELESLDEGAAGRALEAAFLLRRARVTLGGRALLPALSFKLQLGFDRGAVTLKDGWLEYALIDDVLELRVGQWKRPFSRQQITSGFAQQFVDRAITNSAFDAGRDIGIALKNNYERSPTFEYVLGVFNGTGESPRLLGDVLVDEEGVGEIVRGRLTNVPTLFRPAIVGRVAYNFGDIKGYAEPDLEGGGLRLSVGMSGRADFDLDGGDDGQLLGEIDAILKMGGLSASGAIFGSLEQEGEGFFEQAPSALGLCAQTGYVILDRYEPAARYAVVAPFGEPRLHELTAGFSVYFLGHAFKWMNDVSLLTTEGDDVFETDVRFRSMLQARF